MSKIYSTQSSTISNKFGDLTKTENFKNAVCRHEIKMPIDKKLSLTFEPNSPTTRFNNILEKLSCSEEKKESSGLMKRRNVTNLAPIHTLRSSLHPNIMKEKLDRFYNAYNKSLIIDDGMNFSDNEEEEEEEKYLNRRPSRRWSLLQSNNK